VAAQASLLLLLLLVLLLLLLMVQPLLVLQTLGAGASRLQQQAALQLQQVRHQHPQH
jgi:hypothetical protein